MALSPLDSRLWGDLYSDAELAALFSDEAEIAALIRVERALARAEGRLGVIPEDAASQIDRALERAEVSPDTLAAGAAAAGVPVPALVAELRQCCPGGSGHWLHWGATSQDIVDSGLALRLDAALNVFDRRLAGTVAKLAAAARRHARLPMAGRTRSQIATPITFGLRVTTWASAFAALRRRLPEVRAGAGRVALGGASGSNAAIHPDGPAVAAALAEELGLVPGPPWGTERAGLAELGAWLAQVAGAAGKMAGDLLIMGRSEIAEVRASAGGASSTMPQKQNPVAAEATVALARFAASLTAPLHLAVAHHEERDATAWALEWLALPQLTVAAGACLRHADTLAETLEPQAERMTEALAAGGGAVFAEAASFALARHMSRAEAQALVKRAVAEAVNSGRPMKTVLAELSDAPVDWEAIFSTEASSEAAAATVEALLVDIG